MSKRDPIKFLLHIQRPYKNNRMEKYDVVIIGSGLGGLECGYILSKKGYNVCILEKNKQIGGCLQTFERENTVFDTGFHFVGGLDEGQFLNKLFKYFDLLDLPWSKLDETGFAEILFNNNSYYLASGFDQFTDTLSNTFKKSHLQIKEYSDFLKQVGDNIINSFDNKSNNTFLYSSLFEQSAYNFMQQSIDDPLLRNILSGASLTMELCAEKLPLYIFAQMNSSFIQSSWRLYGGGSQIAKKLADNITKMGGTIRTRANVTKFIAKDSAISHVEVNGEEQITGKYFISNLHPALTLSLITEASIIRKSYRNRISNLPNTFGMFTTHIKLKKNKIPYLNRNVFIYRDSNIWEYCNYKADEKTKGILISYQVPEPGEIYANNIDILTPMHWEEVKEWENTGIEKRGENYKAFKTQKAQECIELASERIPGLKNSIEKFYTSSPLTYRDYTGTCEGSAYGIQKDYNNIMHTILAPHTQIPNLLLTGQNLNLHGVLGVSMTSFFTCAKIVGMENLIKDLN